jgi:hypothetical protein
MRSDGIMGKLFGSLAASAGIFLPGTFLIFFVYRFWNELKKYRGVRASLEGINAASVGLTVAAVIRMFTATATGAISHYQHFDRPYFYFILPKFPLMALSWEVFCWVCFFNLHNYRKHQ